MMCLTDTASLIERAQQRDPAAFEALVDVYADRLYGFLFRMTSCRHEAEDLVQEVFVRVVRTISQYRHENRFEAWLFRIATNLARDRARKLQRRGTTTSLDTGADEGERGGEGSAATAGSEPPPGAALERTEDVDRMQQAIRRLPALEREVIMYRHYGQLTFAEIAAVMGTPLGTALARGHRGLQRLRKWMEAD